MIKHNNLIDDGCQWCGSDTLKEFEQFAKRKLMKQIRVSINCPICKFSNAIGFDKDDYLRVYPVDTTYWRKKFLNNPNYVATQKNIYCSPQIMDILATKPTNKCRAVQSRDIL